MGEKLKEWIEIILIIAVVIGFFVGLGYWFHADGIRDCKQLSEITGYSTEYIDGQCWLELCPNTNVAEYDVLYYLDICD